MMTPQISEARKLQDLRAHTDRQLMLMITNRLQRGFAAARRLGSGSDEACREVSKVCSEISRLLPVVSGISRAERARLQSQIAELQGTLTFGVKVRAAS